LALALPEKVEMARPPGARRANDGADRGVRFFGHDSAGDDSLEPYVSTTISYLGGTTLARLHPFARGSGVRGDIPLASMR
jgi:hypothetical protein